ncbi:MAG: UdgX family uracil-DNA binding protein [Actinomycetota bacterium]|nr:UdgX family uracil-DNA binding protein [Actinomycetota bacterium]
MSRDETSTSGSAVELIPESPTLDRLREVAAGCQACHLWQRGTQTVFGDGAPSADLMFVGEQPGDREDVEGEPFVGPAGRELDRALDEVDIDRSNVYITNAVKHFKWKQKGRRRIHETPNAEEIAACRPWLAAEIHVVRPKIIVCLGATAAKVLLGSGFRVTRQRGELHPGPNGSVVTATVHPSAILRASSDEERQTAREAFVADLGKVAVVMKEGVEAGFLLEAKADLRERRSAGAAREEPS